MYEVANNNDLKLGLDYIAWKNGPGSTLFNLMEEGYTDNPYRQTSNHTSGNWAYRAANYALPSSYIDFLQAKGQAKVITSGQLVLCSASTGTISAENAIVAHVSNTDEIGSALASPSVMDVKTALAAYEQNKKDTAASMSSNNTPPPPTAVVDSTTLETERQAVLTAVTSSATSYKAGRALSYSNAGKTGITLTLTPYVGLESMELDMNVQIGELNGYAPNGTPILNTRTVATTIRLLDGQPFAIAGIKRANTSETSSKVPLLGAIPVVGYLFGGEQTLKRTDDLVITITPTFCLASQVNVLKPPVIDDMQNIFDGKKPQGTPDLKFGFDQYLIGG
jgi:Flp pilus assembly secretin CpaC